MGRRFAAVTLLYTDSYLPGTIVLGETLRRHGWPHETVVVVTDGVSARSREALAPWWDQVVTIDPITVPEHQPWQRHLRGVHTKLRIWGLVDFDKILFVDSDTIVCGPLEEALERPGFAAAPCLLPPDSFNSGVMVIRPDEAVLEDMLSKLSRCAGEGLGDQTFLNDYFSDWYSGPSERRLPTIFNVSQMLYFARPAWEKLRHDMRILHYVGGRKPWHRRWAWSARVVNRLVSRRIRCGEGPNPPTLWWRAWREAIRHEPEAAAAADLGAGYGWGS